MVLFRHTLCKVSSGGAIDAVAWNGFAGEDFGPSDCRAVVRPNVPKLAIDATAGCCGCEVSDGLCLVSLPGAASLWVADVSQTPQLRPLASAAPCRVDAQKGQAEHGACGQWAEAETPSHHCAHAIVCDEAGEGVA